MTTPTPQYDAIRMALISCRERFRQIIVKGDSPAYAAWVRRQATDGFKEVDSILANPENQE